MTYLKAKRILKINKLLRPLTRHVLVASVHGNHVTRWSVDKAKNHKMVEV